MSGELPEISELSPGLFYVDYRQCAVIDSAAMGAVRDYISRSMDGNAGGVRILLDLRGLHKYALDAVAFASAKRAFTVRKSAWVADVRNLDVISRVFPSTVIGHEIQAFADLEDARAWIQT